MTLPEYLRSPVRVAHPEQSPLAGPFCDSSSERVDADVGVGFGSAWKREHEGWRRVTARRELCWWSFGSVLGQFRVNFALRIYRGTDA